MPKLADDHANFRSETERLLGLLRSTTDLEPPHQKVIAEVVLLRLSNLLENINKAVICRLLCGSQYLDGTAPLLLLPPHRNRPAAIHAMKTLNRPRERNLPWNDASEIRENIRHLIDAADPAFATLINFAGVLTEARYIRNHIAHKNDGSRKNYRKVLRKYYGASVRGVTCGTLLLSPRVSNPPLVEVLLRQSRAFLRELTRTP